MLTFNAWSPQKGHTYLTNLRLNVAFFRNGILRNFCKIHGKTLVPEIINKVASRPATLLKKKTVAQVFSSEFCKIFKDTFFTEHVLETYSACLIYSEVSTATGGQGLQLY